MLMYNPARQQPGSRRSGDPDTSATQVVKNIDNVTRCGINSDLPRAHVNVAPYLNGIGKNDAPVSLRGVYRINLTAAIVFGVEVIFSYPDGVIMGELGYGRCDGFLGCFGIELDVNHDPKGKKLKLLTRLDEGGAKGQNCVFLLVDGDISPGIYNLDVVLS